MEISTCGKKIPRLKHVFWVEAWVCSHCVFVIHLTTVCFSSSMPSIGSPVTRVSIHLLFSHSTKYQFTTVESNRTTGQQKFEIENWVPKLRSILGNNVRQVTCRKGLFQGVQVVMVCWSIEMKMFIDHMPLLWMSLCCSFHPSHLCLYSQNQYLLLIETW